MHLAYMIFNGESKNVSTIWTEFHCDYCKFLQSYEADVKEFSSSVKFSPKPNRPPNAFDISMADVKEFSSSVKFSPKPNRPPNAFDISIYLADKPWSNRLPSKTSALKRLFFHEKLFARLRRVPGSSLKEWRLVSFSHRMEKSAKGEEPCLDGFLI